MSDFSSLFTTRLILKPIALDDAEQLAALSQDPEIPSNGLGIVYPYDINDAEKMIHRAQDAIKSNQYRWTIRLRKSEAIIGVATLAINAPHKHGEIGYWIGKAFWNKGYATESAGVLLAYAFEERSLHRVVGQTFDHNPASVRVLDKLGMHYEGALREHIWHEFSSEYKTLLVYSMLEEEYREKK